MFGTVNVRTNANTCNCTRALKDTAKSLHGKLARGVGVGGEEGGGGWERGAVRIAPVRHYQLSYSALIYSYIDGQHSTPR